MYLLVGINNLIILQKIVSYNKFLHYLHNYVVIKEFLIQNEFIKGTEYSNYTIIFILIFVKNILKSTNLLQSVHLISY